MNGSEANGNRIFSSGNEEKVEQINQCQNQNSVRHKNQRKCPIRYNKKEKEKLNHSMSVFNENH